MTKVNTAMFDLVLRAVANPENWEDNGPEGSELRLNWNYVDSDVYMACGPDDDDDSEHYAQYEACIDALEAARGEPFPCS